MCSCNSLHLTQFLPATLASCGSISKSALRVAFVRKAADEIRTAISVNSSE
jgi:hypothetical protein